MHPVSNGTNIVVQIHKIYRGHAKQVSAALWGSNAAHLRYKHVMVVDEDIDIHSYEALDWAFAYRVNAGEDDIVIYPDNFGSALDPSTRLGPARYPSLRNRKVEPHAYRRHRELELRETGAMGQQEVSAYL